MKKKNILVTAIGSFSAPSIIASLKENYTVDVFGCDIYPSEWHYISREFIDVFRSPLVKDELLYLEFIITTCSKYDIEIVIPTTDIEVDFFNKWREKFNSIGVVITIGNTNFLKIARDKYSLYEFSIYQGLACIPTYVKENISSLRFPIIAKPRDGRSSEGLVTIDSKENFDVDNFDDQYIYQDRIAGDICTVDCVRDSFGNFYSIPRVELLRTKNGAGTTVKVFRDERLTTLCKSVCEVLNVIGCVNMEFIMNSNDYYLMDINPRFSAGVGFSKLAGYDFIDAHLKAFKDQAIPNEVEYDEFIAYKYMIDIKK